MDSLSPRGRDEQCREREEVRQQSRREEACQPLERVLGGNHYQTGEDIQTLENSDAAIKNRRFLQEIVEDERKKEGRTKEQRERQKGEAQRA